MYTCTCIYAIHSVVFLCLLLLVILGFQHSQLPLNFFKYHQFLLFSVIISRFRSIKPLNMGILTYDDIHLV